METFNSSTKETSHGPEYDKKSEFPDPDKNLLWKLYLNRKSAFQALNNDVDEIVNQCLRAKRHLQTLEDSNRRLKQEARTLRSKYEALLEKNKNDTGIIMRLKDSESLLKEAVKNRKATCDSLLEVQIKNEEKALERKLLEDDREKLVFKSQAITNILRKKNLKHKHLYKLILDENRKYQENDVQFIEETQELKYILGKNDAILSDWLKDNAKRDAAILHLQEDIKKGLIIHPENNEEDVRSDMDSTEIDESTDEPEILQQNEDKSTEERSRTVNVKFKTSEKKENGEQENREKAFEKEWLSKKTLFEAAERQKEHLIEFYMKLNKRMQDLNIEIVNVKEWVLDKEAEKREIWERASAMENLVAEKRRQKPVPPRTSTDEIKIWIDVQRKANGALRKVAYKCLSVKQDDSEMYSEFENIIRNMYLNTLKEQLALEQRGKQEEEKA